MSTATQDRLREAPLKLLAARIREARGGLSHDKLGEKVGTSRQHLISLEKGRHRPRLEMLTRIAEATERDVDWFLDPEVDPASPFRSAA